MHIDQAHTLKPGAKVSCPEDRGDKAYRGQVVDISKTVSRNHQGTEFLWVTVKNENQGTNHVWPSNRLTVLSRAG